MKKLKRQCIAITSNQTRLRLVTLFVLFLSLTFSALNAQTLSQIETITTDNGLPFRDVKSVAQDSLGFMWFGTAQGLLKYDGYSFKVYNSNPNNPNFIENEQFTDHNLVYQGNNLIWFVANDNLFTINTQTDSITAYGKTQGIKGDVFDLHIDYKKQVWIVTDDHWISKSEDTYQYLQKFDESLGFIALDSVRRANREFTRLISDRDNKLWWLTEERGSQQYTEEGERLENKTLSIFEDDKEINSRGTSFFDAENQHYYFPSKKGIIRYDTLKNKWQSLFDEPKSIDRAIVDKEGNTWFSGDTIVYRKERLGSITNITNTIQERLDFTRISQLFVDNNGLLWLTTDKGIVKMRIKPKIFKQLFKSDETGWGNSMRAMFETKAGEIIAMYERDKRLIVFDAQGNQIRELNLWGDYDAATNPLFGARFFTIDLAKNYVYTVNESLVKIRLSDGFTQVLPEFDNRLNITGQSPIITLKDGRLLFGFTLSKLTLYNPETGTHELVFKNSVAKDYVHFRYFLESKSPGIIWAGTLNDGLFKINLNGTIEEQYNLTSNPPLNKNNIMVVHENEDESLWLGTFGGGLVYLHPDQNEAIVYDVSSGLPNDNVVGILPYNEHFLVSTYDGLSFFNTESKTFQNYFVEDGLTHNEFNYASFFKDSNGAHYFGGMNGVNRFDPKDLIKAPLETPILLSNITRYNSESNNIQKTDLSATQDIKLEISPYDQYFQVNWTIPNYFKNTENQYLTRLEGFEDTWFSQGANPYVRYNKLPAGDYVLNVKGADFSGSENSNILKVPITVAPIFYKTWWFIALCVLLLLAIIYGIFQLRVRQLFAIEELRTEISSDLHDNLGSTLTGIAMQTELLEANANDENRSKLNKIASTSRDAISQMRDLVWSIDNRRERTADLLERMEEVADEFLLPQGIHFKIEKNDLNLTKKLSVSAKQHMFYIYKEAITNILKHAKAKNVIIKITNQDGFGTLVIKDDGVVNDKKTPTGFGLINMKRRAQKMDATIHFVKDNGFEIHLKLPFKL